MKKMQRGLAFLLSLCLCLSLMSLSAFAQEDSEGEEASAASLMDAQATYIAEITADGVTTQYETLQDAVNAVPNDGTETTIRVLKDATGSGVALYNTQEPEHIATQKNIVIDFAGHTYTIGNPLVGSTGTKSQAFHLEKGNTVTMKNGTITTEDARMLVQNYCNLTLEGMTMDGSKLVKNNVGFYTLSNNFGSLTIKGDTNIIAKKDEDGKVVGFAFDLWYGMSSIYDEGIKVVFDDSFTGTVDGNIQYGADSRVNNDSWREKVTLTINGSGTFNGEIMNGSTDALKNASITISGGTFSVKPDDKYIAKGCVAVEKDGKYVVAEKAIEYVAQIDNEKYETLADAVKAASADDTITVLKDCEVGSEYKIGNMLQLAAPGATLDLNGKTITVTNNFSFAVTASDVTVKNGTIASAYNEKQNTKRNSYVLVVGGVGKDEAVTGVIIDNVKTIGGISIGGDGGASVKGKAIATISNCNLLSGSWYALCAQDYSVATIESGTYTADDQGRGVLQSCFVGEDGPEGSIIVKGGNFVGAIEDDNQPKDGKVYISIQGGTFSVDPSAFLAKGYEAVEKGGEYVVGKKTPVAQIGNVQYETLQDAVNAVPNDGTETTIRVLKDATGSGVALYNKQEPEHIATQKNIVIDFAGHTYTIGNPLVGSTGTKSQAFHLEKGNTVTMKNGTITTKDARMLVQNYCNLTLEDMTLDGSKLAVSSSGAYTLSNNNGEVNVKGSTSIIAKEGGYAFDVCWAPNMGYVDGTQVTVDTTGTITGIVQLDPWNSSVEGPVKSTLTIKRGSFAGRFDVDSVFPDDAITISGGTFSEKPDNKYIAEGCVAVKIDKTWQVGKQTMEEGVTTTTTNDVKTEENNGEKQTTDTKTVIKEDTVNNTTSTEQTTETRNEKEGVTKNTYSQEVEDKNSATKKAVNASVESKAPAASAEPSDDLKNSLDSGALAAAEELAKKANNTIPLTNLTDSAKDFAEQYKDLGDDIAVEVDLTIETTMTGYTVGTANESVTYEVSPTKHVVVKDSGNVLHDDKTRVENEKLTGSILLRLPIPASFADGATFDTDGKATQPVQIKHIHSDRKVDYIKNAVIVREDDGKGSDNYFVEFSVTGFSSFEILPFGKSFTTNTNTNNGGSHYHSGGGNYYIGGSSGSTGAGTGTGGSQTNPTGQQPTVTINEGGVPLAEYPLTYADVADGAWYRNAVAYVAQKGLMKGVSDTKFAPSAESTRGMVSLILMRLADGQAPETAVTFTDVAVESWYADAASWAEVNRIFTGYADGTFRGDVAITREQLATVLYRYAAFRGLTLAEGVDLNAFADKDDISGYAVEAMRWAVATGLFQGDDHSRLNPANHATRAELATVLMRFAALFE